MRPPPDVMALYQMAAGAAAAGALNPADAGFGGDRRACAALAAGSVLHAIVSSPTCSGQLLLHPSHDSPSEMQQSHAVEAICTAVSAACM